MTRTYARRLTNEVKRDISALREKLLRLYEGEAHIALGYSSWAEYWSAEFDTPWQTGYRQLDAARIDRVILPWENEPLPERQARELGPLLRNEGEAAVVEVYQQLQSEYGDAVTADRIRDVVGARLHGERQTGYLLTSSSQEWYTPERYLIAVHAVLGEIDLDPASSVIANANVRAKKYYTQPQNGLTKRWRGKCYCNPPYGVVDGQPMAGQFAHKMIAEFEAGNVTEAILLLNGNRVSARWFQPLWSYPLCFVTGTREHFPNPHREDGGVFRPSMTPVFVYLGYNFDAFVDSFGEIGKVVKDPSGHEWEKRFSSKPASASRRRHLRSA